MGQGKVVVGKMETTVLEQQLKKKWDLIQYDWCFYTKRLGHRNTEKRPCEDKVSHVPDEENMHICRGISESKSLDYAELD